MHFLVLALVIAAVAAQGDDVPQSSTGCLCVLYTLCNHTTLQIINDGSGGVLAPRVDVYPECNCPGSVSEFGECPDRMLCCHLPSDEVITEEPEPEETWDDCGIKGFSPLDVTDVRVIAGPDNGITFSTEFPWMALVLNKTSNIILCGASILHHHVIMTAAHCVNKFQADDLLVRVGVWNTEELTGSQSSQVQTIIKHQEFGPNNFRNDLALLILKKGLDLDSNVRPICLPQVNTYYDNMVCIATGWGTSDFGTRNYSKVLKKVELRIVPHAQCQSELRKTRLGPWFKLHDSFVCAKGEAGADTCTGDGGGPLVCLPHGSEQYVQVGITAAGVECGNDIPALYTNIALLQPWIQDKFTAGDLKNLQ